MEILLSIKEQSPGVVRIHAVGDGQATPLESEYVQAITLAIHQAVSQISDKDDLAPPFSQVVLTDNPR